MKKIIKNIKDGERFDTAYFGYGIRNYIDVKVLRLTLSIARFFMKLEIGITKKNPKNVL